MKRTDFALYLVGALFTSAVSIQVCAAGDNPSYSGTWQAADKSSELVVKQSGDAIHVTEQRGGRTLCDYTCNSDGKDCNFTEEGKKAKVAVYFNGPKLVEIRTRGNQVVKRRFGLTNNGKTLEVESMPIVPPGKTETTLYAKQ